MLEETEIDNAIRSKIKEWILQDKEQAWRDLHRMTQDEDRNVRGHAACRLGFALPHLPDKEQVWVDLHRLTQDGDNDVRLCAAYGLNIALPHLHDKEQGWSVLIRLTQDGDSFVQYNAAHKLGRAFLHVPNKEQAWKDLLRLAQDGDSFVRTFALHALGPAIQHIPDREQAWVKVIRLAQNGKYFRNMGWFDMAGLSHALSAAFPHFPDREQAWKDLIRLAQAEDDDAQWCAVLTLGDTFPYVPDKEQAWKDLFRLAQAEDSSLRRYATKALDRAFPYITDKEQAWEDMIQLAQDGAWPTRHLAAEALGRAFPYITDKEQAWEDMIRLAQHRDSFVRTYASHSLGKASIFKATEAESEEIFGNEIKNALKFFESSSMDENVIMNPANFCLHFYKSFYAITFEKQEAEDEVQKYLAKAKRASRGSKSEEILLQAVKNLANALTEIQKAREANLDIIKRNLNTYRQYCENAADLIGTAEEETPGAARVLRKGLPIIDNQIKAILHEIWERASAVCKQVQGTPLEELGQETTRYAKELPIQNPLALKMALSNLSSIARDWCEYIPRDGQIHACEQLNNLANMELSEQGAALAGIFEYINTNIHIPRIQTIHISATQQEIVRIAVVQFCFELTESFPFTVKNNNEVKPKIFSTLDIAKKEGVNIVCLPELCLCEEWISEIKEKYPDMIVIGGSFYKDGKNSCPVIMESDVDIPYQPKITPSASEKSGIMGPRMIPGEGIYRYETQFGKFVILICRDFDNLVHYFRNMTEIDMIFCPSFNSANDRFQKEANIHVEKIPSYVLIANAGQYGGTSIFGRFNRDYFSTLVDDGCKNAGDLTYKLCEVKKGQDEVIIADFNLIYKSIQVPTPSDDKEEKISVKNIKKIPIRLTQ